jgi:hypothetical protein
MYFNRLQYEVVKRKSEKEKNVIANLSIDNSKIRSQ